MNECERMVVVDDSRSICYSHFILWFPAIKSFSMAGNRTLCIAYNGCFSYGNIEEKRKSWIQVSVEGVVEHKRKYATRNTGVFVPKALK